MSALLETPYEAMALKARLDLGNATPAEAADPRVIGRMARTSAAQRTEALRLARAAQPQWARVPLADRVAVLGAVHDGLRDRGGELVELLVAEGVPLQVAHWALATMLCVVHPETTRQAVDRWASESEFAGRRIQLRRHPDGVVAMNPARNAAATTAVLGVPVLAAGNALVLCAPPSGPLSTAFLYRELVAPALAAAGAPPGILGVVSAPGRTVLAEWLASPDVDDVYYFGPTDRGLAFERACLAAGKKPIVELSGNDGLVVWHDADLDRAVPVILERFHASGQLCVAPKYAVVHPDVADRLLAALDKAVTALRVGPPEDPDVLLSPVIRRGDFRAFLNEAVDAGAQLVTGGELVDVRGEPTARGPFLRPALLRVDGLDLAGRLRAVREETFFPLLPVVVPGPAADEQLLADVVDFVNGNRYGLRNSLWARDPAVIDTFVDSVHNGAVLKVNDSHLGCVPGLPVVGGRGASGGVFGEACLPMTRTSHLRGVCYGPAGDPFDHLATAGVHRDR